MAIQKLIDGESDNDIREAIISKYVSTAFHFLKMMGDSNDSDVKEMREIIKRYRKQAIFGKYISNKVRLASILSYVSFNLVNALAK